MRTRWYGMMLGGAALLASCKPSDVLNVPPPADQFGTGTPQNAHDAEAAYYGAATAFFLARDQSHGLVYLGGLLTDEFHASTAAFANDARYTRPPLGTEDGDSPLQGVYKARSSLLLIANALRRYEPAGGQDKVGEAFALVGYIELYMADVYCAGVTLSYVPDGGGVVYGHPLTTDSLLGVAEAHFDSALAHAHGNAGVQALASVGLGRARLARAHYAAAAAAVSGVPTSFAYNTELAHDGSGAGFGNGYVNMYSDIVALGNVSSCAPINISDREGINGLDFLSARDPRLVFDSTLAKTCQAQEGRPDSLLYYPTKFGYPTTGLIPLATGVEARLIEAEAALAASDVATWAADLNALRAAAPSTYLALTAPVPPITVDSTTNAPPAMQLDVTFRERAFWLFGTGVRLGDLRRLIRSYHRDAHTVFPAGAYQYNDPNDPQQNYENYGTDVSFTLPTEQGTLSSTNPYYKGCLTSPGTA